MAAPCVSRSSGAPSAHASPSWRTPESFRSRRPRVPARRPRNPLPTSTYEELDFQTPTHATKSRALVKALLRASISDGPDSRPLARAQRCGIWPASECSALIKPLPPSVPLNVFMNAPRPAYRCRDCHSPHCANPSATHSREAPRPIRQPATLRVVVPCASACPIGWRAIPRTDRAAAGVDGRGESHCGTVDAESLPTCVSLWDSGPSLKVYTGLSSSPTRQAAESHLSQRPASASHAAGG